MTALFIVGVAGVAILVVSVLVGDLLGIFDIGDGLISSASIGAALTFFGLPGYLTMLNGGPLWLALFIGAALAAAAMVMVQAITNRLAASSEQEPYELIGLTGITTEATSATSGEVKLTHPREINKRLAVSAQTVPAGTPVVVTETLGSTVKVAPTTTESITS